MASSLSSSKPVNPQTAWKRNHFEIVVWFVLQRLHRKHEKVFPRKPQILPRSSQHTSTRRTAKTAKSTQLTHRSVSRLIFASIHRDWTVWSASALLAENIRSRDYLEGVKFLNGVGCWWGIIRRKLAWGFVILYRHEWFLILKVFVNKASWLFENLLKHHWCP